MPGPPSLSIGTTANFTALSDRWFYSWQPTPTTPGAYALGSLALSDATAPTFPVFTIAVANDDPNQPLLTDPKSFQNIWTDPPLNFIFTSQPPELRQAIWVPIPRDNYVALGVFVTTIPFSTFGPAPPPPTGVKCLRQDFARLGVFRQPQVYAGSGYGGIEAAICIQPIQVSLAMFAQVGACPPNAPVFIPAGLPENADADFMARLAYEPLVIR